MDSTWKPPPPPHQRVLLDNGDKSINYEATAFVQHEKLSWISQERVDKFLDNNGWTESNFSDKRLYFARCAPLTMDVYSPDPTKELRPLFSTVMNEAKWQPCKVGTAYGPSWASHWFRLVLQPPSEWDKDAEVHLIWNSNSEATLWTDSGVCLQGFAGGTDQIREEYMFDKGTKFPLTVYVEMACNNRFGCNKDIGFLDPPPDNVKYTLEKCELGWFNRVAWDLMWDLRVINDVEHKLDKDSPQRYQILRASNHILNRIDALDQSTYQTGRELAAQIMYSKKTIADAKEKKNEDEDDDDDRHTIYAVGHCHIDTAWLWPYGETRRKVIRSWASQLRLMQLYDDYHFTASQAQQYDWLRQDSPELFKRIQDVVRERRNTFHVVGGTWVEMDGNLPSGEGFVRQFLYGQQFFLEHFGRRCKIFFLPDTFGYSGQLPQIIRLADMDYFFTQKLSWNLINPFPHHSFIWEGIDGSSVLTHFCPSDSYVDQCSARDLFKSRDNYKNKACNRESLMLFGWGDGGGGPTTMHLERLKRYTQNGGMRFIPRVKTSGALPFFEKLSQSVNKLPRYVGELYFELHRGTYTSHALIKKGNRTSELLLQFVEFLYCTLVVLSRGSATYPSAELDKQWKLVLLNQFHDVLPGSSIEAANIDARNIYDRVHIALTKLLTAGMHQLQRLVTGNTANACVVNNKSWCRRELLMIRNGDQSILSETDKQVSQVTYDQQTLLMVEVGSCSIAALKGLKPVHVCMIKQVENNRFVMENEHIYVELLSNGLVDSLIHKRSNKQLMKKDADSDHVGGNHFLLFEDKPLFWDAWDIELYHLQKYESVQSASGSDGGDMKIIEHGPLRCGVEYSLTINAATKSTLTQRIFLEAENGALLFETDVDWKERHKCLKVQFPLNIRSTVCNYDIQFGYLQRPTVQNNTEDIAKFEVVGHKFADLSEYDFGCALLNDCKYGYSCFKHCLRLSLLRAPKRPDPNTDIHRHLFRYALLPHTDTFQRSNVKQCAENLNNALKYVECDHENKQETSNSLHEQQLCMFEIDSPQVILDTVKMALDASGDVILRFYEAFGGRTQCKVSMKMAVKKASICNLLEDVGEELKVTQVHAQTSQITLYLQPFEIKTVRLSVNL